MRPLSRIAGGARIRLSVICVLYVLVAGAVPCAAQYLLDYEFVDPDRMPVCNRPSMASLIVESELDVRVYGPKSLRRMEQREPGSYHYYVDPGLRSITIEAEMFDPLVLDSLKFKASDYICVRVRPESRSGVRGPRDPGRGSLRIETEPDSAAVLIDGSRYGLTPETLLLQAGRYSVRVGGVPGYDPVDTTGYVREDQETLLRLPLQRYSAKLDVTTDPAGAIVYVNGGEVGKTPYRSSPRPSREIALRLELPGHVPVDTTVKLKTGIVSYIEERLRPATGSLEITTIPPGAQVSFDGGKPEQASTGRLRLSNVPVGTHVVRARKDGNYRSIERQVTVATDDTARLTLDLRGSAAMLVILSSPPNAAVWIDGKNTTRTTPVRVDGVSTGEHQIQVEKPGYGTVRRTVRLARERIDTVSVQLELAGRMTIRGTVNPRLIGGEKALYQYIERNQLYPKRARLLKKEGSAELEFVVSETGVAEDIRVLAEHPPFLFGFGASAVKAIREMRFEPGLKDGRPVPMKMVQEVRFHLDEQ